MAAVSAGSKKALVDQLSRLMRGTHQMKVRLSAERPDRAAYGLLFPLFEGDKRASDLSDLLHTDPSTISRHVSHLITNGLAQRVPDQQDGRATLVSLTDKGRDFCNLMRSRREASLGHLLESWSEDDVVRFSELLGRFNDDVETNLPHMLEGIREAYASAESATNSSPSDKESA